MAHVNFEFRFLSILISIYLEIGKPYYSEDWVPVLIQVALEIDLGFEFGRYFSSQFRNSSELTDQCHLQGSGKVTDYEGFHAISLFKSHLAFTSTIYL